MSSLRIIGYENIDEGISPTPAHSSTHPERITIPSVMPPKTEKKSGKKKYHGHTRGMIVFWQCAITKLWWVALAQTVAGHLGFLKGKVEEEDGGNPKNTAIREMNEESGLDAGDIHVLPDIQFLELNEKGNISVGCWAAVVESANKKNLAPRKDDELARTIWMEVPKAISHLQLRPARQNILAAAYEQIKIKQNQLIPGVQWMSTEGVDDGEKIVFDQSARTPARPGSNMSASSPILQNPPPSPSITSDAQRFEEEFPSLGATPSEASKQRLFAPNPTHIRTTTTTATVPVSTSRAIHGSHEIKPLSGNQTSELSRDLTRLLRWQAYDLGLKIHPGGYVKVDDIIGSRNKNLQKFKKYHSTHFAQVVAAQDSNAKDKKRLGIEYRDFDLFIRARQGHGGTMIPFVDDGEPISSPLFGCVHGTSKKSLALINGGPIESRGLKPMDRCHIHFAKGLPGAEGVISGMRVKSEVYLWLDMEAAMKAGIRFFESENGVVLTRGNKQGLVPIEFLRIQYA